MISDRPTATSSRLVYEAAEQARQHLEDVLQEPARQKELEDRRYRSPTTVNTNVSRPYNRLSREPSKQSPEPSPDSPVSIPITSLTTPPRHEPLPPLNTTPPSNLPDDSQPLHPDPIPDPGPDPNEDPIDQHSSSEDGLPIELPPQDLPPPSDSENNNMAEDDKNGKVSMNKPSEFDGTGWQDFASQLIGYLHVNKKKIATDEDKIITTLSYMTKKDALSWATRVREEALLKPDGELKDPPTFGT